MSSKLLADTGRALYGDRWQSALARDLQVDDRTMRRWVAGDYDPPPGVWTDLLRLTQERAQRLDDLRDRLKQAA
jgi:hypothetical protein